METYTGHVRTPGDAIILFEACRIGLLPRVQRRLSEKERQSIKSGSVFVWDEREAGMRRWTDGKSWSASRVSGSFLTYREMEGKRGGGFDKNHSSRDSLSAAGELDSDGSPDGYRYKVDGLIKQSFSITTSSGQHLHLISYYSRSAGQAQNLQQPSNDPQLRHIRPEKGMYPESTVNEQSSIPAVTRGPMSSPQYTAPAHPPYGAAAPYQYSPHTNWAPPSPMHTPPPSYAPYGYQGHPHPAYSHTSPLQHVQYPPHGAYPAPGQTAFDRPPPHLQNTSLPPPPPPSQYGQPPSSYPAPPYGHAHDYPYHGQPGHPYYPPPPTSQPAQPYHTAPMKYPPPPAHTDPSADSDRERSSRTPPDIRRERSPARLPPPSTTTTSSQTIPSISSMLNGGDPPAILRSKSGSPGSAPPRGPSDIPSHKLGFETNRDMEALRNLDKSTFKGY
ncbi:hypothetical protein AMS68_001498 [Peltaster fructicola]|uniref:cAMP-independent regulatory protein pac2 n=1 Tax=Peltaster fructicola TaxID=286661 RepID=A0A6H0XMW1_9PEZI|nr:hypothetical protein AMS68_001498 [Peltaster fructicola]